ncbi:2-keto-4-pentenoate hydratase [Salinibacterium sp. ZJ70]|uniref:2-keto-4-pentenoate hydratase n=1 Tax=Salinibacterium sp. ZJ70 TaxID=2708084 RepID=UPI00141FB322|nr:2-keto-4-pentenoate hydratase [Salinibacterium sp. ZJ70]
MDQTTIHETAEELLRAERSRTPVAPLAPRLVGMTVDDAYAIQSRVIEAKRREGDEIVGHKIGLTSGVMQQMMGVDSPDFGHLLGSMMLSAEEPVPLGAFIQPRIEVEFAYILGADLPQEGCTAADVDAATEWVVPCLELIDSRIVDWRIGLLDTVADNASSAAVVLGTERIRPSDIDLTDLAARLDINGETVATGSTADVLGTPAGAVAWLANAVGQYGVRLKAGHVVLSGSCTRAIDVVPGDVAAAVFTGREPLTARFTD